jgi:hypothetical protein
MSRTSFIYLDDCSTVLYDSRSKMTTSFLRILLISTLIFQINCYLSEEEDETTEPPADVCEGVTHSFADDVVPIFTQCTNSGCHEAGSGNIDLVDNAYDNIQAADAVDTDSPEESLLLQKPLGEVTHTGGAVFSGTDDDDYKTILCWIQEDDAADN